MVFRSENLSLHENGLRLLAFAGDLLILSKTYYSVGRRLTEMLFIDDKAATDGVVGFRQNQQVAGERQQSVCWRSPATC
jgi:hypothetical protein